MKISSIKHGFAALALLTTVGLAQAEEITVSAAASLTNAFKEVAQRYEAEYPDAKVRLNFGASGALLQQIAKGAPVDVFASADQETMDQAQQKGLVAAATRRDFVANTLVAILPFDSTLHIGRLTDLTQSGVNRIAIGNPASVPVGRYTQHALEAARLWGVVSDKAIQAQNVRQALDYVARGEVDVGFVYATDAAIMKDKVKVAMTVPLDVAIRYPIARTTDSAQAAEADRFLAFVHSPSGQAILAGYGFQKP